MSSAPASVKGGRAAARRRVWILDDSALEAELTRRGLAQLFDVEVFHDGAALLEQLSSTTAPDAVIVDWQMPGLSGLDVCQFLRSDPTWQSIAVLILTVQRETRDIVEGLGAGADDFLSKPYVPAELVARVSALLRAKELRDQLTRAERSLRSMLGHLPDAVVCVDEGGRVAFVNLEAERVFGQPSAKLAGASAHDLLPASVSVSIAHAGSDPTALADVTIGERVFSPAVRKYEAFGGSETAISFRDVTLERRYDEDRTRLLARERQARTEAEEANRAKDEFLAVVSHELRTPLNAMLGWTRMLRSGAVRSEERKQHALATIERNATAQTQLIDDILDVSRIITGKLHLTLSPVSLVKVIEMAMEAARPAANAKNLELTSDLDPAIGAITGDPDRLQQVVWNLVSNAVKFSRPGGRVTMTLRRAGADAVEVEVTDQGEGIDPTFLPHMFERFRQAEASTTRVHGGLGLGLAIVRHIVELHGGTVAASSEGRGHGSTFIVRLRDTFTPAESEPPNVGPRSERRERISESATAADLTSVTVLIVEDDADTRDLLVSIMRHLGAEVTASADAAAGMAQLLELRPDVLISDIGMPHEDGYSFIKRVRALSPDEGGRTPAIALTAYAREQDRTRALASGFDTYLPKPVDPVDLGNVVASVLGRRPSP